jgi:hypothetical protein
MAVAMPVIRRRRRVVDLSLMSRTFLGTAFGAD